MSCSSVAIITFVAVVSRFPSSACMSASSVLVLTQSCENSIVSPDTCGILIADKKEE